MKVKELEESFVYDLDREILRERAAIRRQQMEEFNQSIINMEIEETIQITYEDIEQELEDLMSKNEFLRYLLTEEV